MIRSSFLSLKGKCGSYFVPSTSNSTFRSSTTRRPSSIRGRRSSGSRRHVHYTTRSSVVAVSLATAVLSSSSLSFARAFSSSCIPSASSAIPYVPPAWCDTALPQAPPHGRLRLANLPTPLYRILLPDPAATTKEEESSSSSSDQQLGLLETLNRVGASLYVKRDDATGGVETGGNKLRKLEFLLADALSENANAVVTIGGEQSNHCRATAAAARMVGLEPHLILRTRTPETMSSNLIGNVMMDRLVGSQIYTCTPGEYGRVGSQTLVQRVCQHLENETKKKAYPIPVGGSNGLGSWGYIEGVREMLQQWKELSQDASGDGNAPSSSLDHVVFACGSGGTAAGIVLGMALAHGALGGDQQNMAQLHAIGVCDDPDYFYQTVADIADQMGLVLASSDKYKTTEEFVRAHLTVHQGKGRGYAQSTPEELEFVTHFARATGIVLDPVYSGKALYHFWRNEIQPNPQAFAGKNVLFWHTGGALGMYDKCQELTTKTSLLESSPCQRLDVYGKSDGIDISK